MTKRKQQDTKENLTLTVFESNKRCSNSGGEYFDRIPADLVIKILSKLSAKSMAKCRCVCKLLSSIIRQPNYNQLFPIKYPDPPRFIFTFLGGGMLFSYTSTQPENPDENSSLVATAHHHTDIPRDFSQIFSSVHGLVCYHRKIKNDTVFVIYNPITGQYVTLPILEAHATINYFAIGYDPINKRFKVLCVTSVHHGTEEEFDSQHQVLTFETGRRNLFWRKIQCRRHYYAHRYHKGICIKGVLYYAATSMKPMLGPMIVCFDVRSEKFGFITWKPPSLINYKGKLGSINSNDNDLVLWVLEHGQERKWSKHIYVNPLQWPEFNGIDVNFLVTSKGEAVFCPNHYDPQVPFYLYYYNLEENIVVRVRVEVPESQGSKRVLFHAVPNYLENMKLT